MSMNITVIVCVCVCDFKFSFANLFIFGSRIELPTILRGAILPVYPVCAHPFNIFPNDESMDAVSMNVDLKFE